MKNKEALHLFTSSHPARLPVAPTRQRREHVPSFGWRDAAIAASPESPFRSDRTNEKTSGQQDKEWEKSASAAIRDGFTILSE